MFDSPRLRLSFAFFALFLLSLSSRSSASGQESAAAKPLLDVTSSDALKHITPVLVGTQGNPKGTTIIPGPKGLEVHFPPHQPGDYDHPGFHVTPADGKPWDLSNYGHIEAKVTNTGTKTLPFVMQVEDGSGGLNNLESIDIKPGDTKVLKVVFGYQYQYESDSPINLKNITEVFIFCWGTSNPHDFRIEELQAAGVKGEKPEMDPANVLYRPKGGVIVGKDASFDPAKQIEAQSAQASAGPDGALALSFSGGGGSVKIKPLVGKWDLAEGNELLIRIRNTGKSAVSPDIGLDAIKVKAKEPIAPGAETEMVVSFVPGVSEGFDSSKVPDIEVLSERSANISITSMVLGTATEDLPATLGQKPPVEGEWVQTFDEEFNGSTLDFKKWNIYGAESIPFNYFWDRNHNPEHIVHFSKDNISLQGGTAVIRLDRKTGRLNDSPSGPESKYASSLLTTYGKWTQRYGYFETRLKLPVGLPGLWATFDLIPDRGKTVTPKASRISVAKLPVDSGVGGTEFDVMDNYSGEGPDRVTTTILANKSLGTASPYIKPDKEGFIVMGLLWLPGEAIVYCNGKQILRVENPRVGDVEAYLKYDLILGGVNKSRDENLRFPDDLIIDYVRVWQRKDLATPQDGAKPNAGDPNEDNN